MTTQPIEREAATVAEVALAYPQAIGILNQYQLDFCCSGNQSFSQACKNAHLNPEDVWNEILRASGTPSPGGRLHFENWTSSMLADFIIQHHHEYVRESIPRIRELLEKVCSVHSDAHPELMLVKSDFYELADELLNHMPKEEHVLFPAIKQMEAQIDGKGDIHSNAFTLPIRVMEEEHVSAGALVKSIRSRTNNYSVPAYACPTYQLTFQLLREFDEDLIQHIHLENNILFPRVSQPFNSN
jgi:regulator of cell morphogenesis and NO signaling